MNRRIFATLLGFGLLAMARPVLSAGMGSASKDRDRSKEGQQRDSGNDCCGDSNQDARDARQHENARQRAVRTPQDQPDSGGWGSNTREISAQNTTDQGGGGRSRGHADPGPGKN